MDGTIAVVEGAAVNEGLLTVVAAVVLEVAFQPVGLIEYVLLVVVALAYVRYLVTVRVVEKDEVTVMVVSPDQSPASVSAIAAGVSSRTIAATAELMRILNECD